MHKTDWFVEEHFDWHVERKTLFTYDEQEKQEHEINKETRRLIFKPKFIPFYPSLMWKWLNMSDILVYWFIDFYLANSPWARFYFSDLDLVEAIWLWESTISSSIKKLHNMWLINKTQKMKSGWGTIRFIVLPNTLTEGYQTPEYRVSINKNKINKNKINKLPLTPSLKGDENLSTSNTDCNELLNQFISAWNKVTVIFWWHKWLPKTIKVTDEIKKTFFDVCKKYNKSEIELAIWNYIKEIQKREKWTRYWEHRFTFYEFLKQKNWLQKFINY